MRSSSLSIAVRLLAALFAASLALVTTQISAQPRMMVLSGEVTSPAYEGWWPNEEEGGYTLFFGYQNSNWEEHFDIPVGPDNYFTIVAAGALDDLDKDGYDFANADLGQPTHFYPRRNPFLFTVDVPEDFGSREVVWTLRTHDHTARAYGTLKPDYRIDPQVISTEVGGWFGSLDDRLRSNIAPELRIEGEAYRTVRVGQALDLAAIAEDPDDFPPRANRPLPRTPEQIYRPPASIVAMSGPGLRFSWTVYRGAEQFVNFDPVQFKTYTDTRVWSNSPWSPPFIIPEVPEDNRWVTSATFSAPGDYVLRGIASDGSMFTYRNIYVTVTE
ncbi:MAG: hypothetical protein R3F41_10710 [Gammaproteobacteria bacterium]|nr:hypothetical protein [Pseudomonadales bacterium]MCP5348079.1 hypothetical protein [Pseudomonadales bacterium]